MKNELFTIMLGSNFGINVENIKIIKETKKTFKVESKYAEGVIQKKQIFSEENTKYFTIETYRRYYVYKKDVEIFKIFILKMFKKSITNFQNDIDKLEEIERKNKNV